MSKLAHHILRIGLGIMFLWIGILIYRAPDAWANFIQPWAVNLLPESPHNIMVQTAFLDMAIGFFLLIGVYTWLIALVATFHLITILIASGIDDVTVRDIGLVVATLTLFLETLPANLKVKLANFLHVQG